MAVFFKVKTNAKNGSTLYRPEGFAGPSIRMRKNAFVGDAPAVLELNAENLNLIAKATRERVKASVPQEIADAAAKIAAFKAEQKAAKAARLAAMTPEERQKRDDRIAKAKASKAAKG